MVTMQGVTRRDRRLAEAEWFGGVVRRRREQRGWTQEQLAEGAQISATYLGILERGENVPTLSVILQLASALEVHPMDFFREYPKKR
jgi:XRE family transcriptional regulator, regulator of sulfur utilization